MTPIPVNLTNPEMVIAAAAGCMRQIMNVRDGREHLYGNNGEDCWTDHIEGAGAEMAVAKHTGQFWNGAVGQFKADDVGVLQVRQTGHDRGCLILHHKDHGDKPFILVTGQMPNYTIRGWLYARDGKKREHWRTQGVRHPAFFVQQKYLFDFSELTWNG